MNTGGTTQFFSRFGLINSVKTLTSIKKDEEFFVNYKYAMNNSPKWYRELYKKFASENQRFSWGEWGGGIDSLPTQLRAFLLIRGPVACLAACAH